jgi:hypothetical protein
LILAVLFLKLRDRDCDTVKQTYSISCSVCKITNRAFYISNIWCTPVVLNGGLRKMGGHGNYFVGHEDFTSKIKLLII